MSKFGGYYGKKIFSINQLRRCQAGWLFSHHMGGLSISYFFTWTWIAQSLCDRAFSLLSSGCQRRPSSNPEEASLPPFDLKSLITGAGCRFQVFSSILDSSAGLSAGIQSAGDLVFETMGSNPAFSRGRQLVSFRFEYRLPLPGHRN